MKTKLRLIKTIFTITWLGLSGVGIIIPAEAQICPLVETIVSSNPDSANVATYLSPEGPGWHSNSVAIMDLGDAKFDSVLANTYRIDCVYDTPTGYLVLHPDDNQVADVTTLMDNNKWYCSAAQSEIYRDRTEEVCTCSESIGICGFNLQPIPYYLSSPYLP